MPNFCAIFNCGNRGGRDNKSFYRLPAIKTREGERTTELCRERREKWLAVISRDIKTNSLPYVRVCSDHFISGKPSSLYDSTNPDWVPSQHLGHEKVNIKSVNRDAKRYKRLKVRDSRKKENDAVDALLSLAMDCPSPSNDVGEELNEASCQTTLAGTSISKLETEIQRLIEENRKLKTQVNAESKNFDQDFFRGNDERVKYYTGLASFSVLLVLFQYLDAFLPHNSTLTSFQTLILSLMKLRLNLSHVDLGHRFGIGRSTVSRIFLHVIDVMYIRLKPLVFWPEREHLQETMPLTFRTYFGKRVTIIIDCFEIFLERPSNLSARASTWSSYKHNNTVKYLIGITPQGVISYISEGWGGRVSDKYLVEHSDFLRKLDAGDVILADRGFNIDDSVGVHGCEIMYPVFTKGKKQLSGEEVEKTRRIANVRIHVERVIGSLRQKYSLLHSTIPIDYVITNNAVQVTTLDKIVVACCCLTNMCPSVVPFD